MGCYVNLQNVSLRFRLYKNRRPDLKNAVINWILGRHNELDGHDDLWALKEIDLRIEEGESVGIVGDNGAGKTTLLKVMSRIYPATKGSISFKGRLVPLLDLGVGFTGELTARENIRMAGLIMGLSRHEIRKRTESILDFSELKDFADVPIKYYSKGMTMRLGFTTATEIEPEVLLLDEIFSGGDIHWSKKAAERMESILNMAKIVVIASHSMELVTKFCKRVVVLSHGRIVADGNPEETVESYKRGNK